MLLALLLSAEQPGHYFANIEKKSRAGGRAFRNREHREEIPFERAEELEWRGVYERAQRAAPTFSRLYLLTVIW